MLLYGVMPPWKIFLPITGSFFVFMITDSLPVPALCSVDVICYIYSACFSGRPHDSRHYSYLSFLRSLYISCRSPSILFARLFRHFSLILIPNNHSRIIVLIIIKISSLLLHLMSFCVLQN